MSRSATATSVACALALAVAVPAHAQRANERDDDSAALVGEGRAALRANRLDDAAKALDQAIALNPRRVEAYVLRAAVFAARRQFADGVALMRRARELAPDDLDVLGALGAELVLAGDAAAGVPLLEQVVAREPQRYDAQLVLGSYRYSAGAWPAAITALEAYFAHRPRELAGEDARHQIDLGDAYLRYRQPAKAVALFDAAARARPDDLRARIGVAWATAALDCARARPLLQALEAVADQHPEVLLVDGQCALALGEIDGALGLGRRYLARAGERSAAGHALVGDALAARGNLADARKELEAAQRLEPTHRRWTVRLAHVLRRAGQAADAVARLDALGAPATPGLDPEWYVELGEGLIASNDPAGAATRLVAAAAELPDDVALRTTLGAAQLAAGQADAALSTLDSAALERSPRAKKLLVDALATVAATRLAGGDAAGAEPLLARADTLGGTPVVWRDLGIARLALGKPAEAVIALDRAARADSSPIVAMLAARAHAEAGDLAAARPLYERALAGEKDNSVEIALDWAASELAGGDAALAVTALERTAAAARGGPLAARHKAALAAARHASGLVALRAGNGARAVELLRASQALEPALATRCDLAVAAVVAGDAGGALAALKAVTGQRCPFPPPADTQAAPILTAFVDGLSPRRAARALDRLTALAGKSSGAAATLLGTAMRVVALAAAQDAYRDGQLAAARKYLAAARAANARVGADDVAHNLAVLELADGRVDAAIVTLERLAGKVPEALVNLGIAYERKGEHGKALEAWRRAKKLGVRFAPLAEWIESKARVHGGAP